MLKLAIFGADEKQIPSEIPHLVQVIHYYPYDEDKISEQLPEEPNLIMCFASEKMSVLEIAQSLRMNYPETPIYFIAYERKDFDKKKLIKNGFSNAYLLPWEKTDLFRSLKEEASYSEMPELRDYRPIKVVDFKPSMTLDFGLKIFLAKNNKLLPFSSAGDEISQEKYNKLTDGNMNTLFVHKDEITKFHEYTAGMFKTLLKPGQISETERLEKLETVVRDLISDMFIDDTRENTFGKSQALLKEVKEVIKLLITDDYGDIMKKIDIIINQEESFYLHLTNVSTFSGLFAIVLGFEHPQELALAGLLHDIGKINLPVEMANIELEDLGVEALAAYHNHPKYTLDVIRLKRLVISEKVSKAILHHHEAMNGTGYPSGLEGARICAEGRILAIANTFDHLTSLRPGEKSLTAREAIEQMYEENTRDPGRMILDTVMLKKLKEFFIK